MIGILSEEVKEKVEVGRRRRPILSSSLNSFPLMNDDVAVSFFPRHDEKFFVRASYCKAESI